MNTKRIRELAALHALQQTRHNAEEIEGIEVDGVHVDQTRLLARQERLQKGLDASRKRIEKPNLLDQGINAIEERADEIRKTIGKLKEGEKILANLTENTERVQRCKEVTLHLKDGQTLRVPVRFVDARVSLLLYRMNQGGVMSSYVPLLGHILPPLFAATSLLGGRVARWMGDDELAGAAQKTGQKQLQQSAALLIPVVDAALGALTLLKSYQDARTTVHEAVGVADIARLSQEGAASVPPAARNPLDAWKPGISPGATQD